MHRSEERYHQIAERIDDAKKGKMFGSQCIKAPNGKAAVILYKEDMVFKLNPAEMNEALSLDGAHIFSPMDGRPMNGWVQLSPAYADRWEEFARRALNYVRTLEK